MQQYHDLLRDVIYNGVDSGNRTGIDTRRVFGRQLRFDLTEGFPLVTTKKIHWKSVVYENLWFLKGGTNTVYLKEHGVSIWDEWADENGDLGPVYGKQWRNWLGFDQIKWVINEIRTNPTSRRLIVSAWNVTDLPDMALMPCHCFFQFNVRSKYLDCNVYIRSNDLFLGAPFNIAGYALLTSMIAKVTELTPGELVYTIGDAHIYSNHFKQVFTQLERVPRQLPLLKLDDVKAIDSFTYENIHLEGYDPYPAIKAPVAI